MELSYTDFGAITVEGKRYEHDVIVEAGRVRARSKKPSKPFRSEFGHTPLSVGEDIPWSGSRLIVGTGASGRLPIMPEVLAEAEVRDIELTAVPTAEACRLLAAVEPGEVYAILHVTC